jgi:membrane protein
MLGIVSNVATSLGDELTERLKESRFGRDIFGPRIAEPAARWLSTNFVEADDPATESGSEQMATVERAEAAQLDSAKSIDVVGLDDAEATEPEAAEPEELEELDLTPGSPKAVLGTLKALGQRIKVHNLVVVAAGIAFWGLLAIPATLFAVVSIAGLVLDPDTVKDQVRENLEGLPDEAKEIIAGQLEGVSGGSTGGLITGVIVGLLLALWTASGAMAKLMGALNTIYDTVESRKFVKLRGTALGLTFGGIVFISSAIFLLAAMPALLSSIDAVGDGPATLFNWLRFPILGLVMVFALGVLYHVGPDRRAKYRPLTVGAVVAMVLWISLSALFSVYTATVGSYNETYGSIGGIVILLLWLFITAFVVLLGAEIHAETETAKAEH